MNETQFQKVISNFSNNEIKTKKITYFSSCLKIKTKVQKKMIMKIMKEKLIKKLKSKEN
jgi:hypothetical protein